MGVDKSVLLNLYRSLVRSKLDYGCIVYGSARPSYLKMLNTIHHQGLRLALGAFRKSPVESLYVEAGELPLEQRRVQLSHQYVTKLKSTPSNPAFNCVFRPEYENKYLIWVAVVTPTDRPKSVRNCCVIELFCGVVYVVTLPFDISVGVWAFVIGLSQISSFFS